MEYKNRKPCDAYANYGKYYLQYNKELMTFSCGYEGKGVFWKNVQMYLINGEETIYPTTLETFWKQPDFEDYTLFVATYGGEVTAELTFKVTRWGVSMQAKLPAGYTPVFQGEMCWGSSEDCFAVRLDTKDTVVRCAVGPAVSKVDTALFDRMTDSAVVFDISPNFYFDWEKSVYYTKMRSCEWFVGVKEHIYENKFAVTYNPINKHNTFPTPPVGWMTWYAVQFDACEEIVLKNAKWLKENLYDYGVNTIWVDWEWYHSCFDMVNGPENIHYFSPDPVRYPNGLQYVADRIEEMELIPALWIGITHETAKDDWMKKNPEIILANHSTWCGEYFFDLTNEKYKNEFIPSAIRKVPEWHYKALKWDCLPITQAITDRYHEYLAEPEVSTDKALKDVVKIAREELGKDFYMLSCAGAADREIRFAMDLFDAARIGGDIFTWQEFIDHLVNRIMRFYVYHNVQLYCDPDNVVVREEFNNTHQAISRASLVSIFGLPFTMGDQLVELSQERINILKKCIPPLDAHPADLRETGIQDKILVVNQTVAKEFEQWNVVNVLNLNEKETEKEIFLKELSLDDGKYLVYDFWNNEFLGVVDSGFKTLLEACQSKIFAVRKLTGKPQIVSTNRHISQGGVDIIKVEYDEGTNTLNGISSVVAGDEYIIRAYDPYKNQLVEHCILSEGTGEISWKIKF